VSSYGEFTCESCRDDPGESCTDACAMPWADELSPPEIDYWPSCRCCGRQAHLVRVLVPLEAAFKT
jgi:hypothetical protein